jgi:hypothetical protein
MSTIPRKALNVALPFCETCNSNRFWLIGQRFIRSGFAFTLVCQDCDARADYELRFDGPTTAT